VHALICDDYQGIEALRIGELPEPHPGPGSVLIKVEAVAVNFADTLMVSGNYQMKPETPFAPGYEVAGTVIVANQAKGISPGDRICGFLWYGGMAEKAVVLVENATHLPDNVSSEIGATLSGTCGTSYHALVDRANLQARETLLVLGAAGGVGTAAVQIGKALGARVIAAVSSEEKAQFITEIGADDVIRYDQVHLREGIEDLTGGEGGFAAGTIPEIPLNLPLLKGIAVIGVFWGRFTTEQPEHHAANAQRIVEWVSEGRLHPSVQRTFTLDEGRDALRWVADRRAVGRVVVTP
jgi:NADPH2:quinone reductase